MESGSLFGGSLTGLTLPLTAQGLPPTINPPTSPEQIAEFIRRLWHIELFNAGDSPVHLNQLVIAILVAIFGIWIAKRITRIAQARLIRLTNLDRNAAAAIQKILFYLLVAIVVMIALPIAGIPITIFTVIGGALAIGVGFGAQNLFNNLISGLIIMTEQPVRLGDIVEVGDMRGKVEDIGNRCTRIRRFDGVDVLVPNSHFLENPVVNWTLFDADVRTSVTVGVAYGTDTKMVASLIRKAVEAEPYVNLSRDITVLFNDFGDNALAFEVLFWTTVGGPVSLRELQSNVRFRIDEYFREANITIAFPQRDVHLDTLRPLQVSIVDGQNA